MQQNAVNSNADIMALMLSILYYTIINLLLI